MLLKTEWIKAAESTRIAQIKVGDHPRFTNIWVVTINGRVFCRNSTGKQGGWFMTLLNNPNATIKLNNTEFQVTGKKPLDLNVVVPSINKAYKTKYGKGINMDTIMAYQFIRKKYWDKTIELILK